MSLQARLDAIRSSFESQVPPEALETMARERETLQATEIAARFPKLGDAIPDFELPDHQGVNFASRSAREKGPLVLSFFRGRW